MTLRGKHQQHKSPPPYVPPGPLEISTLATGDQFETDMTDGEKPSKTPHTSPSGIYAANNSHNYMYHAHLHSQAPRRVARLALRSRIQPPASLLSNFPRTIMNFA